MKVIDVLFLRNSVISGYVLRVCFDTGFTFHLQLSRSYSYPHPDCVCFSTQPGFVPRPKFVDGSCSLPFKIDTVGKLQVRLPTCCGYFSVRGKWLTTGSFHRFCIVDIDDLISSL